MKPNTPKKLATLCALIGAGVSCIGVAQAHNRVTRHDAGPVTDAANRFASATLPELPTHPQSTQYNNDQFEKLFLALPNRDEIKERKESEPVPPMHPNNDMPRSDVILAKREADPGKLAGSTVIIEIAESAESASPDNAVDAISATLIAIDERRSAQFALDPHEATKSLVASENGDAPITADNAPVSTFVPVARSKALPSKLTRLTQSDPAAEDKGQSNKQSPTHEWLAVNNDSLDAMRGGFDTGAGLMVSFGIERAVYINGNLTTSMSFNIPDVSKLATDQARITANQTILAVDQAKIVAEQARLTADQAKLTADQARVNASPTGVGAVEVAAAQAGLSEQVRISSEQARLTSEQAKINSQQASLSSEQAKISSITGASVNLVQNGPGNTFEPATLPQTVAATVIQNTLNNQSIKSLTVINTTVNSLSVLKGINAQATLSDALGNSLGIR